ncbi:MAG: patatin [Gammaproteobacteria bacterium]|nr:MAG: patatin [Gammaproteobacteria bacterium]
MKSSPDTPRIGLALGSGSSRGWSHIGIIKALEEIGVRPHVVTGCSIGSIVAAAHAAGNLNALEQWVTSLRKRDVAGFFDINWRLNGVVDAPMLRSFLARNVAPEEATIEALPLTYGSVATNLVNGREIWFTDGSVLDSIMASIALPGLFVPFRHQQRWLVDGGLVNPVPVSLCHALGAEIVIAVNLNGDILGKHFAKPKDDGDENGSALDSLVETLRDYSATLFPGNGEETPPSLFDVIASSVNITQDRITRSRMAGDPPDVLLTPRLAHIGLLEFHRAKEAIEQGRQCVERMQPAIEFALNQG